MKAHPDAVTRQAAEVVTPLPIPSRLGMLRFERLNDPSWAMLYLDPACEHQFGLSANELRPLESAPYASLMEPAERYRLHDEIQAQLANGAYYRVRYRLHGPSGVLDLLEVGEPYLQAGHPHLRGFLLVSGPGASLPEAVELPDSLSPATPPGPDGYLQRLAASRALGLFQRAFEQTPNAFLLIDRSGRVEYVNPSFTSITLYTPDEVQGRNLAELPALECLHDLLHKADLKRADQGSWQGEFHSLRKNLEGYWGRLSISRVLDEQEQLTHYLILCEDITESKLAQQRIERLACTDNLTGLVNRSYFILNLEERFAASQTPELALLLVDIDNFKRINDSLGHRIGDQLLAKLARRLRSSLDDSSVVARFASNEFAVLIDGLDPEGGRLLAQHALRALDRPFYIDNQLINISGSAGLACAPLHGYDPQTLMRHAGLALHKAKANGKSQLQVFTNTLNDEADFKLFLENSLRRALAQNELEVFYQPKLCLRTGKLLGLEALLRWNHPEKGMIRPDQFISVAEETGLIIPIGEWAARQACRMAVQLSAQGLGELQMAINLSPRQFTDAGLVDALTAILREEGLSPERLELELTESLLLDATEVTKRQLNELKALGLTLAMDDFGTGYSSLSYLKKFPIDVIKIDRSFIKDIPLNQSDMEITSAVIAMARNLRLKVVAEGIESSQQLSFLRHQRCDIGQGYLFDRPIPGQVLVEGLRRYLREE